MKEIEYIKNSFTGGHYAIKSTKSKTAFTNPMQAARKVPLYNDDIVADIGAYVGEYSLYASKFCKQIYAYEASPFTFDVLCLNKKHNIEPINKAVVGDKCEYIELYLSKGIGATNSVVKSGRKGETIIVPAIYYNNAVKNATIVKIDVEGAEYTYDIIQPNLRAVILEFHPIVGKNWIKDAQQIMDNLKDNHFSCVQMPNFRNGWDTNSAWIRI